MFLFLSSLSLLLIAQSGWDFLFQQSSSDVHFAEQPVRLHPVKTDLNIWHLNGATDDRFSLFFQDRITQVFDRFGLLLDLCFRSTKIKAWGFDWTALDRRSAMRWNLENGVRVD